MEAVGSSETSMSTQPMSGVA